MLCDEQMKMPAEIGGILCDRGVKPDTNYPGLEPVPVTNHLAVKASSSRFRRTNVTAVINQCKCCGRLVLGTSRHHGCRCLLNVVDTHHPTSVRHVSRAFVVADGGTQAWRRSISGGAVVAAVRHADAPAICSSRRIVPPLSL